MQLLPSDTAPQPPAPPPTPVPLTGRSVAVAGVLAVLVAVALNPIFIPPFPVVLGRSLFLAMGLLLAFTAARRWSPSWLPRWLPQWMLQVLAVAVAAPIGTVVVYLLDVGGDVAQLTAVPERTAGIVIVSTTALVLGLVLTLGALYRERDAQARAQALEFALEREVLERRAVDARLSLLQAQIEPHFLFNTLANVQALVETGSPRAAPVLQSLIDYLRAAMPRLHGEAPTLGNELQLVRAYLDLMLMRMPDRLQYRIEVEPALQTMRFPQMALLTLVENAVRHGIDPSEQGGLIEVGAVRDPAAGRVRVWVRDTGVGMAEAASPGTGLTNLRQRLQATFGVQAELLLSEEAPHGVRAEIALPLAASPVLAASSA
jgi:signal transduction histidine kinase